MSPQTPSEATIEAHRAGDVMWLDWFYLPARCRGEGRGGAAYAEWEGSLPHDITRVRLFAADTGTGRTDGFWERMGFSYVYDTENPDALADDERYTMHKGVNEHPTPPGIWVIDDDDSDDAAETEVR